MSQVERFLMSRSETNRHSANSLVFQFQTWLAKHSEFSNLDAALDYQEKAVGKEKYRIGDLLVEYVKEAGGTFHTMQARYNVVRSFFYHSRAELPKIVVQFMPTKDASVGRLNLDSFKIFLKASSLRDQAIYLSLFQGLIDQERFFTIFNPKGYELGEHIKKHGLDAPYRIEFLRGRKGNPHAFNSFIGHDALEAWKQYFEHERLGGYPKEGEACALDQYGKTLSKQGFWELHCSRQRRLGFANGNGKRDRGSRYGFGSHELRDLARSILEKAKTEGFNEKSAEYWMGHQVDRLFYNKLWSIDPAYIVTQYKIAEKHLNILSGNQTVDVEKIVDDRTAEDKRKIAELEDRLAKAEKEKPDLDKYFEENIGEIIKKFNKYGVDMKIRKSKQH